MIRNKELEKELLKAAETEYKKVQVYRERLARSRTSPRGKIDEVRRKADDLRRRYLVDPALRDIQDKFTRKLETAPAALVCPICGGGDKGNTMNGRPWCFKCNVTLVNRNRVKKWLPIIKVVQKKGNLTRQDLKMLHPGLHLDKEDE